MNKDLTKGDITKTMLVFALPMIVGNLLQQLYNVADTLIVGKILGADALAAVGSAFTLMTFITSVLLGLCMGSGAVFSISFGEKNEKKLKSSIFISFVLIFAIAIILNFVSFSYIDAIMAALKVPQKIYPLMREYLWIIFIGIIATFFYNYFACLLRAVGNSFVPLVFLGISAVLNIVLDLVFVLYFKWGVAGAAIATVFSQYVSGVGIFIFTYYKFPQFRMSKDYAKMDIGILKEISQFSFLTCIQQSVMNFGILMVQGLVNSFGPVVMAAFAAAVKIDSFAYMPVQDFGNAFSTFIAQNYGAKQTQRIKKGIISALIVVTCFCLIVSTVVFVFAKEFMLIFVQKGEVEILSIGIEYLRVVGSFYIGIGYLFLLYGLYRGIQRPGMSLVLTIVSLGTRVLLAYYLSYKIGPFGIWVSVPIGWILADFFGFLYYYIRKNKIHRFNM